MRHCVTKDCSLALWQFFTARPLYLAARGVLVANTLTKTVIIPQNHGDKLHKQGRSGNSFAGKYLNSLQQNRSAIELPSKSNGDTVFHPRFSCLLLDTAGGEPRLLIIGRKI